MFCIQSALWKLKTSIILENLQTFLVYYREICTDTLTLDIWHSIQEGKNCNLRVKGGMNPWKIKFSLNPTWQKINVSSQLWNQYAKSW